MTEDVSRHQTQSRTAAAPRVAVIGAGPAGLAAAWTLVAAGADVEVFEAGDRVGGLARSFVLWGHTVDLGPHRFFTQDARVDRLWRDVVGEGYRIIERRTRIYSGGRFFAYPLQAANALWNIGPVEAGRCVASYLAAQSRGRNVTAASFEAFMVRRFGRRLYERFFASYSEKLWGIPCDRLDVDFAAQRIQGFSLGDALRSAIVSSATRHRTTLDRFAYPTGGTGSVYETLARRITAGGGRVHLRAPVARVVVEGRRVAGLATEGDSRIPFDHVISTMPLTLLVKGLGDVPPAVAAAAASLRFRNTIMVYVEVDALDLFPDQWLYIHEPRLRLGRVTNFRNWAPELCGPSPTTVLALEYWCDGEDAMWTESEDVTTRRAIDELRATGLVDDHRIVHTHVVRIPRCYPVYTLDYKRDVATIAAHLATYDGLTAIGRAGSFKYNNQDHSLLMGILAAENVLRGAGHDLWAVNADSVPHETAVIAADGAERAATASARSAAIWLAVLWLAVGALFAYTVELRRPWFGQQSAGHHFWLTAHTLLVLENWYEDGALHDRFAMLDYPRSVEAPTIRTRSPYVSYPVGFLLPLHALTVLSRAPPSVERIMRFNLANHLAIALVLATLAFAMARGSAFPPPLAVVFAAVAAGVALLTPGPLYWLQNVYFADQAVILPFALVLLLEWLRDGTAPRARRAASALLPLVLFWGSFVDYLFVFVALTLFAKRWLAGEHGWRDRARRAAAIRFWIPVVAALAIFFVHIAFLGELRKLAERAVFRSWAPSEPTLQQVDWVDRWHFNAKRQYGRANVAFFVAAVVACVAIALSALPSRQRDPAAAARVWRLLGVGALATLPCLAQIYVLRNHSVVHDFSALKLVLPIALVPWVVLPLAVAERWRWSRSSAAVSHDDGDDRRGLGVVARLAYTAAPAMIAAACLAAIHPNLTSQFPPNELPGRDAATFVRRHAGYRDVIFSPHVAIELRPPQLLSIARKVVYEARHPKDFRAQAWRWTHGIREPYSVDLLFDRSPSSEWQPLVGALEPIREGELRLYRGVSVGGVASPTRSDRTTARRDAAPDVSSE